jgi:hypothetical protein
MRRSVDNQIRRQLERVVQLLQRVLDGGWHAVWCPDCRHSLADPRWMSDREVLCKVPVCLQTHLIVL